MWYALFGATHDRLRFLDPRGRALLNVGGAMSTCRYARVRRGDRPPSARSVLLGSWARSSWSNSPDDGGASRRPPQQVTDAGAGARSLTAMRISASASNGGRRRGAAQCGAAFEYSSSWHRRTSWWTAAFSISVGLVRVTRPATNRQQQTGTRAHLANNAAAFLPSPPAVPADAPVATANRCAVGFLSPPSPYAAFWSVLVGGFVDTGARSSQRVRVHQRRPVPRATAASIPTSGMTSPSSRQRHERLARRLGVPLHRLEQSGARTEIPTGSCGRPRSASRAALYTVCARGQHGLLLGALAYKVARCAADDIGRSATSDQRSAGRWTRGGGPDG